MIDNAPANQRSRFTSSHAQPPTTCLYGTGRMISERSGPEIETDVDAIIFFFFFFFFAPVLLGVLRVSCVTRTCPDNADSRGQPCLVRTSGGRALGTCAENVRLVGGGCAAGHTGRDRRDAAAFPSFSLSSRDQSTSRRMMGLEKRGANAPKMQEGATHHEAREQKKRARLPSLHFDPQNFCFWGDQVWAITSSDKGADKGLGGVKGRPGRPPGAWANASSLISIPPIGIADPPYTSGRGNPGER